MTTLPLLNPGGGAAIETRLAGNDVGALWFRVTAEVGSRFGGSEG